MTDNIISRKLDADVARALGLNVKKGNRPGLGNYWVEVSGGLPVPRYSTEANATLEIIGQMQGRGWMFACHWTPTTCWSADFVKDDDSGTFFAKGNAQTFCEAVSMAAIHGLTGKEWQE